MSDPDYDIYGTLADRAASRTVADGHLAYLQGGRDYDAGTVDGQRCEWDRDYRLGVHCAQPEPRDGY